ncbi:hypothetical protein [Nonomuraea typhae]|uniref:hypothetical protein n=1 Tax=Nonomuraea typhae TaxID=2603600 RepID=UPI003CCDC5E2
MRRLRFLKLVEVLVSLSVEGVHLARRPLLRRDLPHVDEAALFDPDQQRVDGALGDAGESPDPVAYADRPDKIARTTPLQLLSNTSYR